MREASTIARIDLKTPNKISRIWAVCIDRAIALAALAFLVVLAEKLYPAILSIIHHPGT